MIIDQMTNFDLYRNLIAGMEEAYHFITSSSTLQAGKYQCGRGFSMVQEGITYPAEEGVFEFHKKYVDVIMLISGKEMLEWAPVQQLQISEEYDPERDIAIMKGRGNYIELQPGMFYILFPDDAHKACCHLTEPERYRKVVVKIPMEQ